MRKQFTLLMILVFSASMVHAADKAVGTTGTISGKILNTLRKPVAGVPVTLYNQRMQELNSVTSDKDGEFVIKHGPCVYCTVAVSPDVDLGLASALFENIPGRDSRNLIVQLQHGFLISGRITHGGKGLRGLTLKATAASKDEDDIHKLHQGGSAKTGWTGSYSMVLTPGPKKLHVINEKHEDLVQEYEYDFDVTSAMTLPDIDLPAKK
jgi:hypothetical protein